jgi:peptide/nickel transport system permease protein
MSNTANAGGLELISDGTPPSSQHRSPIPAADIRPRRSWMRQVVSQTFSGIGAKLGLTWIAIIGFCAIFAPVLANSFPLLIKVDGHWSSPMLHYLTATDITLMSCALAAVVLWFIKPIPGNTRLLVFLGFVVLTLALTNLFVRTPFVRSYEEYREMRADGDVQRVINAPVPFSPNDHLNDEPEGLPDHPWKPSRAHLLGTESNKEDILSVMIHACRIAMSIGLISTGIAVVIGILVGGLMGYFAGIVDLLGMRLVEIFGAIPTIYLLLAFCAAFERNIYMVMAIIGLTGWTTDARFVRAEFLKLRNQDFVHGAIAAGLPLRSVLFRHILPNALPPLLVSASFGVASAILSEAVLSFLGLGLPVDAASWGRLLNEAARGEGGGFHWWLAMFPGFAIFLTVFSYNLIGEAFRDALDPKLSPQ